MVCGGGSICSCNEKLMPWVGGLNDWLIKNKLILKCVSVVKNNLKLWALKPGVVPEVLFPQSEEIRSVVALLLGNNEWGQELAFVWSFKTQCSERPSFSLSNGEMGWCWATWCWWGEARASLPQKHTKPKIKVEMKSFITLLVLKNRPSKMAVSV